VLNEYIKKKKDQLNTYFKRHNMTEYLTNHVRTFVYVSLLGLSSHGGVVWNRESCWRVREASPSSSTACRCNTHRRLKTLECWFASPLATQHFRRDSRARAAVFRSHHRSFDRRTRRCS
jgi:hypothetical protein